MEIDEEEICNEQNATLNEQITSSVDTDFYLIYRKLPTKTPVTIRLFERNEYYTCHGDDALFIARELLHSTNALKYWKTSGKILISIISYFFLTHHFLKVKLNRWKRFTFRINSFKIFYVNFSWSNSIVLRYGKKIRRIQTIGPSRIKWVTMKHWSRFKIWSEFSTWITVKQRIPFEWSNSDGDVVGFVVRFDSKSADRRTAQ